MIFIPIALFHPHLPISPDFRIWRSLHQILQNYPYPLQPYAQILVLLSKVFCNLYYKNNTKYWHFAGHDLSDPDAQCKLWNNDAGDGKEKQGNTEFNVNAIKSALCNFIDVNTKDISELIIKRLLFMYDNDTEYVQILIQILDVYNK